MRFLGKYYDSIDNCPIASFQSILKGGSYKKMHVKGFYNEKKAFSSWKKVFDEYINEFGLPASYVNYLNKKSIAADYWSKSVDDKFNRTLAEMQEREAVMVMSSEEGEDFKSILKKVSQNMGFRVDPNVISVREFYSYVNG